MVLGGALLLLIIAFAVPLDLQHDLHKMKTAAMPSKMSNVANSYIVNSIFFSLSLVGATAGTAIYFLVK